MYKHNDYELPQNKTKIKNKKIIRILKNDSRQSNEFFSNSYLFNSVSNLRLFNEAMKS